MAHLKRTTLFGAALAICLQFGGNPEGSRAATIQLTDGRVLTGELGETAGVAEDPTAPSTSAGMIRTTPILVVEDGLRRTFLHKLTSVRRILDEGATQPVRIRLTWQNEAKRGAPLGVIGAASRVTPFDKYGRRVVELPSNQGPIAVVQGVTEVTPVYTRVQGLRADPRSYIWDMRMATSSLPRETLARILSKAIPRNNYDQRMQVVRLYLQAERYRDAARELETIRHDFAGSPDVPEADLKENLGALRDLAARGLLEEIELWRESGRFNLARTVLERFPVDGVAGDTLQRVRELLDQDHADRAERADLLDRLRRTADSLAEPAAKAIADRIVAEIEQRLSPATASRLTAFSTLASGDSLGARELMAVAISGWLLGSNNAAPSLPTALTLVNLRDRVREYLAADDPALREAAFVKIRDSSEATVKRVAALLARLEPPLPLTAEPSPDAPGGAAAGKRTPGSHRLSVRVGERTIESLVQLPPEYDPLRRYPTILTLGDLATAPVVQLDFWAGAARPGVGRAGQAMRHGYVVIAIDWARDDQLRYEYTPTEHAAVLATLRDAMRRISIDSDRVFLTGHGVGGDLAWDVALAHPDHWAGVLPFLGVADRYCHFYTENAAFVPWRIVLGELDGDKVKRNARELDRYLSPRFDATVVEYRGRGYDALADDIQRSFDWMGRKQRGAPPEEFECRTMRPWDNYFWWIEAEGLPEASMVAPAQWPRRGARATSVRGRKFAGNRLGVFSSAEKVTVWLSPDLVDFDEPLEIRLNGRRITSAGEVVEPDLRVLLEDARTRAERQRPYWAKVESR